MSFEIVPLLTVSGRRTFAPLREKLQRGIATPAASLSVARILSIKICGGSDRVPGGSRSAGHGVPDIFSNLNVNRSRMVRGCGDLLVLSDGGSARNDRRANRRGGCTYKKLTSGTFKGNGFSERRFIRHFFHS